MGYLKRAQAQNDRWVDLLRRLPASGLMPGDDELLDRLAACDGRGVTFAGRPNPPVFCILGKSDEH